MYDGMSYDPIQGQGHETLTVENSLIFKNKACGIDLQSRTGVTFSMCDIFRLCVTVVILRNRLCLVVWLSVVIKNWKM